MKCEKCGSDLPEDSIFCMVCGVRVGDEQFDVEDYADVPFGTVLKCPKCGAKNSRTDRWCGSCDANLDEVKRRSAAPSPEGPSCPRCISEVEPRTFSFNTPQGACPDCQGLGSKLEIDPERIIPDSDPVTE